MIYSFVFTYMPLPFSPHIVVFCCLVEAPLILGENETAFRREGQFIGKRELIFVGSLMFLTPSQMSVCFVTSAKHPNSKQMDIAVREPDSHSWPSRKVLIEIVPENLRPT